LSWVRRLLYLIAGAEAALDTKKKMAAIEENWIKMGKRLSWNMFRVWIAHQAPPPAYNLGRDASGPAPWRCLR